MEKETGVCFGTNTGNSWNVLRTDFRHNYYIHMVGISPLGGVKCVNHAYPSSFVLN